MKLACASWGFREHTLPEYFAAIKELGIDYAEVNLDEGVSKHLDPHNSDAELAAAVRQASDAGVEIVAIAGGNDFTAPHASARQVEVDSVRRQIDVCAAVGATVLRLFAGWAGPKAVCDETFGWVRECFEALAPHADELGVTLAMENHGGITATAAQCLRLLDGMPPCVGLNYDPANFRHVDEDPLAALMVLREHIVYSHWKDVRLVDGAWEYCGVGEGIISWKPVAKSIAESYDGFWAIEYEEISDVVRGTRVSVEALCAIV